MVRDLDLKSLNENPALIAMESPIKVTVTWWGNRRSAELASGMLSRVGLPWPRWRCKWSRSLAALPSRRVDTCWRCAATKRGRSAVVIMHRGEEHPSIGFGHAILTVASRLNAVRALPMRHRRAGGSHRWPTEHLPVRQTGGEKQ